MKPKTVLQLLQTMFRGGTEKVALNLAIGLKKQGWETIIAGPEGPASDDFKKYGIKYVNVPAGNRYQYPFDKKTREVVRLIQKYDVDVIQTHMQMAELPALVAAQHCRIGSVTTFHGDRFQKRFSKSIPLMFPRIILRRFGHIVSNSEWTKENFVSKWNISDEKITTIYNGTDMDLFNPNKITNEQKNKIMNEWNIQSNDRVILLPARMSEWKGHKVAISAAKLITQKYKNTRFIFAGELHETEGGYADDLKNIIKNEGLESYVKLVGDCEAIEVATGVSDIVLNTSVEAETFGNTIVEAQAMKKPIIATRIGATGENMKANGKYPKQQMTGWRIEPNNPQKLAEAIEEVINMEETSKVKMGERAREFVKRNFSIEKMCEETINVYESTLRK